MLQQFNVDVDGPPGLDAGKLLRDVLDIGWEAVADRFDDAGWRDSHPSLSAAYTADGTEGVHDAVDFSSEPGARFRTVRVPVIGSARAVAVASDWLRRCQWFEVMPMPFDVFEFAVKTEAGGEFAALLAAVYAKDPPAPGEGEETADED
mgnify:FL=1